MEQDAIFTAEEGEVGEERVRQMYIDREDEQSKPLLPQTNHDRIKDDTVIHEDAALIEQSYLDYESMVWWRRPSILLLLPPFFLFCAAYGSTAVPKLNLIQSLICQKYFVDKRYLLPDGSYSPVHIVLGMENDQCNIPEIGALVSEFALYQNLIGGILGALTAPKLGAMSDRVGRRYIIAFSSCGTLVSEIITIICATYSESIDYHILLIGSFCEGIVGSFLLAFAVTTSYATDCTPPARRSGAFGIFHGSLFLGIGIGPTLGGLIVEKTKTLVSVFWFALVIHIFFLVYLLFFLPESLTKARQKLAQDKYDAEAENRAPVGLINVFQPLSVFWPKEGSANLRKNLLLIALLDFIMFGVSFGASTVIIIYSKIKFHWTTLQQGYFLSAVNITRVSGLVILLPLVIRIFRKPSPADATAKHHGCDTLDTYIIRFAIFMEVVGYSFYGFSDLAGTFVVGGMLASLGGMASPTLQSALTKHVPARKTGQVLGALALSHCIARIIGPTVFNAIYYATAVKMPRTVFVFLIALFGFGFVMAWGITPGVSWDDRDDVVHTQHEHTTTSSEHTEEATSV